MPDPIAASFLARDQPSTTHRLRRRRDRRAASCTFAADAVDELFERHDEQMALDLRLEHLLCEVVTVLDGVSIEYRALQGSGTRAHRVPRSRRCVRSATSTCSSPTAEFDAAIACAPGTRVPSSLRRAAPGIRRTLLEGRVPRTCRRARARPAPHAGAGRVRTATGADRSVRYRRRDSSRSAATKVAGLDGELAFVHACFHAALGDDPPRLVPLARRRRARAKRRRHRVGVRTDDRRGLSRRYSSAPSRWSIKS